MGTTIDFQRTALGIHPEDLSEEEYSCLPPYPEPHYIVLTEAGSNNLIDHDGRIARDWCVFVHGPANHCMKLIYDAAITDVDGGMLVFRGRGRATLPENYIARYRQTLKDAVRLTPEVVRSRVIDIERMAWHLLPHGMEPDDAKDPDQIPEIDDKRHPWLARMFAEDRLRPYWNGRPGSGDGHWNWTAEIKVGGPGWLADLYALANSTGKHAMGLRLPALGAKYLAQDAMRAREEKQGRVA